MEARNEIERAHQLVREADDAALMASVMIVVAVGALATGWGRDVAEAMLHGQIQRLADTYPPDARTRH